MQEARGPGFCCVLFVLGASQERQEGQGLEIGFVKRVSAAAFGWK